DFAVTARRDFDALDLAVGAGIRPGVFLAVVRAREADLLELLTVAVVLPPVDGPVLVLVDLNPDDACAVHVAPGVDLAVTVRVVLQERKFSGLLVVLRSDTLACLCIVAVASGQGQAGGRDKDGADERL